MVMMPLVILAIGVENDRACMADIYQQYYRLMLLIAWRYANVPTEVDDIVSDSCVALIRNLSTIRTLEPKSLRRYIAAAVRNTAIDHCRKQRRERERCAPVSDETIAQMVNIVPVDGGILLREELESVRQAIAQLSERERDVLRLKCQQGKTDTEIAEMTGLSQSSVRKYIFRARQHLKAAVYSHEE